MLIHLKPFLVFLLLVFIFICVYVCMYVCVAVVCMCVEGAMLVVVREAEEVRSLLPPTGA